MRHHRPRQLVALLAVAALLLAMTMYGAHVHHAGAAGTSDGSAHCDLCLQFGGTGAPPAPTAFATRASFVVIRLEPACDADDVLSREQPRSHRSRAPPILT
ncbi:MAG TPA: hypothetical protein VGC34_06415 [Steroidobacteraceae bacterium]